jgi:hypothetical protein
MTPTKGCCVKARGMRNKVIDKSPLHMVERINILHAFASLFASLLFHSYKYSENNQYFT